MRLCLFCQSICLKNLCKCKEKQAYKKLSPYDIQYKVDLVIFIHPSITVPHFTFPESSNSRILRELDLLLIVILNVILNVFSIHY